jgi:glucuronokinase
MIVRQKAYPRAALVGNPSDGYFGKTIAFTFSNFDAEVVLYETPELEIVPNVRDHSKFNSIADLAQDVQLFGYYGGIRLLKAAVKRFFDYAGEQGIALHDRNFTIRYHSDIPHLVGLAGSSAIITAGIKALMTFYDVTIPKAELASIVLAVETEELGISAGLQDRVAQAYGGLVYMDFDRERMETHGCGRYETLDADTLPPLYIAYRTDLSQCSEIVHNNLRFRWKRGDPEVLEAMKFWAGLTDRVREALVNGRSHELAKLFNSNFDCRAALYDVGAGNQALVQAARDAGASAKFTGSGGAIIGTYPDESVFDRLQVRLTAMNVKVIRPVITKSSGDAT